MIPIDESTHPLVDDDLKTMAKEYHEKLVELAVEQDEEIMMAYLEVCRSPATAQSAEPSASDIFETMLLKVRHGFDECPPGFVSIGGGRCWG